MIYKITNAVNGKVYIGKTADLERRKAEHMKKRRHFIGKAINKYGPGAFVFEVLEGEIEDEALLNAREMYWIEALRSHDERFGYNLTLGGDGTRFTEAMRAARSGPNSWMFGKKHAPEARAKMSASRKGVPRSPRQLAVAMGVWERRRGKPLSQETKAKLAAARAGWKMPETAKAKLRRPKTPQHIEALKAAFRKRRTARVLECRGERLNITDWATRLGVAHQTINERLKNGWSMEEALGFEPRRKAA